MILSFSLPYVFIYIFYFQITCQVIAACSKYRYKGTQTVEQKQFVPLQATADLLEKYHRIIGDKKPYTSDKGYFPCRYPMAAIMESQHKTPEVARFEIFPLKCLLQYLPDFQPAHAGLLKPIPFEDMYLRCGMSRILKVVQSLPAPHSTSDNACSLGYTRYSNIFSDGISSVHRQL